MSQTDLLDSLVLALYTPPGNLIPHLLTGLSAHEIVNNQNTFPFLQEEAEILSDVFPDSDATFRHREVVSFTCGLLSHPHPLLQHCADIAWKVADSKIPSFDDPIFESMFLESAIDLPGKPGHNPYINQCDTNNTLVYIPSQTYRMNHLKESVNVSDNMGGYSHNPHQCGIVIHSPDPPVIKSVLQACRQISHQQKINNLFLISVRCEEVIEAKLDDLQQQVFNLNPNCE